MEWQQLAATNPVLELKRLPASGLNQMAYRSAVQMDTAAVSRGEGMARDGSGTQRSADVSKWTHSLCEACYRVLEPGREPVRLVESLRDTEVLLPLLQESSERDFLSRRPGAV